MNQIIDYYLQMHGIDFLVAICTCVGVAFGFFIGRKSKSNEKRD